MNFKDLRTIYTEHLPLLPLFLTEYLLNSLHDAALNWWTAQLERGQLSLRLSAKFMALD